MRGTEVQRLVAHASPRDKTLSFTPVSDAPRPRAASVDPISVVYDGTPDSSPAGTVELVTNSVANTLAGDTCPGATGGAFCANVTLNQFFNRPLSNTFVQITSITGADGAPIAGHEAMSDAPELGLDASLGLFKYTSTTSSAPGVLGQFPNHGGSRDWVFKNPDDADTAIDLRVVAALTYADYAMTSTSEPFVDACAGGEDHGPAPTVQLLLPFPFTLYDTTEQAVTINRRGVIALGATSLIAPAKSVALPSSGNVPGCTQIRQCAVPRPAVFAFWDALVYNAGGGVCTQTIGEAPNRAFAVTWRRMARLGAADIGADYTFTAVLHEGTDTIDLLYEAMNGPLPNAAGGAATVGVQNAAGTLAKSETSSQNYGTGARHTLTPVP